MLLQGMDMVDAVGTRVGSNVGSVVWSAVGSMVGSCARAMSTRICSSDM